MQFDDSLYDCKPDPEPAFAAIKRGLSLGEKIKDVRHEFSIDSDTVVAHAVDHMRGRGLKN